MMSLDVRAAYFDHNTRVVLSNLESKDVTAAAEVHTGAMIALIPSHDDAMRIVVEDGEPVDQIHCTLEYLGEAADIPDEMQQEIINKVIQRAQALDVIEADGFAIAIFNPGEHEQPDGNEREACVVLLLSGDELAEAYELICDGVKDITGGEYAHKPWIPHITLAYREDANLTDLVDQVGQITFDTVRVAFGGEIYDIPLGQEESGQTGTDQPELETSGPPQTPKQTDTYTEPTAASVAFDLDALEEDDSMMMPEQELSENEIALVCSVLGLTRIEFDVFHTFAKERDVNLPGEVGHQLRDYWVRGPGAAKIRWNTEGDGTRCIKLLRKHVGTRAGGLCQEYHQMATGKVMGRHTGRPTE
jgi:2'-5' RNA ligase